MTAEMSALPIGRPVRHRRGRRLLALAVLAVAGLGLFMQHDVRWYRVASGSMQPTLAVGDRVQVQMGARTPQVGEIVVFHPPAGADPASPVCGAPGEGAGYRQPCGGDTPRESRTVLIKRVVAVPRDMIAVSGGRAVVDGVVQPAPHAASCETGASCDFPVPIRVPAGAYYMLGDNRGASDDSRFWGPVPQAWIIGTAVRCSLLAIRCQPLR